MAPAASSGPNLSLWPIDNLHFEAKITLTLLCLIVLLVASATLYDLYLESAKRRRDEEADQDADQDEECEEENDELHRPLNSEVIQDSSVTGPQNGSSYKQLFYTVPELRDQRSPSLSSTSSSTAHICSSSCSSSLYAAKAQSASRAWYRLARNRKSPQFKQLAKTRPNKPVIPRQTNSYETNYREPNLDMIYEQHLKQRNLDKHASPSSTNFDSLNDKGSTRDVASFRKKHLTARSDLNNLIQQLFLAFSVRNSAARIFDLDVMKNDRSTSTSRRFIASYRNRRFQIDSDGHRHRPTQCFSCIKSEPCIATSSCNPCGSKNVRQTGNERKRKHSDRGEQHQSIDSLHGLRFLSMIWIIVIHSYNFALSWMFFSNSPGMGELYKTAASQLLANGTFACDSFLFAAGFLLPYLSFSNVEAETSPERNPKQQVGKSWKKINSNKQENIQRATSRGFPWVSKPAATNSIVPPVSVEHLHRSTIDAQSLLSRQPNSGINSYPAFRVDDLHQREAQDLESTEAPIGVCFFHGCSAEVGRMDVLPRGEHLQRQQVEERVECSQQQQYHSNHRHFSQQPQLQQVNIEEIVTKASSIHMGTTAPRQVVHINEFTFKRVLVNSLHRYIRMMPLMMAIIGMSANLLRYLGEGPAWDESTVMFDKWCRKNWWVNGLFLHNFLNRENMCLSHSWYSAVDMQLFIVGQLIMFVLAKSRALGLSILLILLFGAQLITATLTLVHHLPAVPLLANFSEQSMNLYYGEVYIKPYCRASPYLIGMLLAYCMRTTNLSKIRLNMWQVSLGWFLSLSMLLAILLAMQPAMNGQTPSELEAASYSSLSRPLWACATGWMIFACITNHGGPFAWILSARIFVPLSRLTYPAFLIHPIVMAIFYGSRQTSFHFSHYLMLYLILGNIVITYVCAFLLSALFELPILSVERLLKRFLGQRKSQRSQEKTGEPSNSNEVC